MPRSRARPRGGTRSSTDSPRATRARMSREEIGIGSSSKNVDALGPAQAGEHGVELLARCSPAAWRPRAGRSRARRPGRARSGSPRARPRRRSRPGPRTRRPPSGRSPRCTTARRARARGARARPAGSPAKAASARRKRVSASVSTGLCGGTAGDHHDQPVEAERLDGRRARARRDRGAAGRTCRRGAPPCRVSPGGPRISAPPRSAYRRKTHAWCAVRAGCVTASGSFELEGLLADRDRVARPRARRLAARRGAPRRRASPPPRPRRGRPRRRGRSEAPRRRGGCGR